MTHATQGLDSTTIQQASDRGAGSIFRVDELGCFYFATIHTMGSGALFAVCQCARCDRCDAEDDLDAIQRWLATHPGDVRDALTLAGWEVVG